jgi:hypothetical protein
MARRRTDRIRTVSLVVYLVALLAAFSGAAAAMSGTGDHTRVRALLAADTVNDPVLRLGWKPVVPPPVQLRAGPTTVPPPAASSRAWTEQSLEALEQRLGAQHDSLWAAARAAAAAEHASLPRFGSAGSAAVLGGLLAPDSLAGASQGEPLPTGLAQYGELGIRIQGRSDLGGAWNRFRPCNTTMPAQCEPGFVPRIAPETQLGVLVQGTVLDRVHVAVDYDATREFDASNNINVYYEGRPGELVRRVEVGDVSFRLPGSRFLTQGIPAGNWGLRATSQAGPLELQALWARQGGQLTTREFRQPMGQQAFAQQTSIAWDDAAFAEGQFFFLFDPAEIRGYPHVDVLALSGSEASRTLVATGVQLYRYTGGSPSQDGSTVIVEALPREPERAADAVRGPFRLLQAGVDYQLHRSGIWVALKDPLREDEALAVAYVSAAGDSIGDLADRSTGRVPARLRLLKGGRATHRPGSATWPLEMRQIYRISGTSQIDRSSVRLEISRGERSGGDLGRTNPATGGLLPYLQLFGLDDAPPLEELDPAHLYYPGDDAADLAFGGAYVVFPTLRPFAEPPPLPGLGLSADAVGRILGGDANAGVYDAADERARKTAARFRLNFEFASLSHGPQSVLSLGAIGIREGSERITVGGRLLQRDVDYDIQYDVGEVQLRDAAGLFAATANGEIRATFEQTPVFGVAPTSVAGLTARYPLGTVGELGFVGLAQQEQSLLRRPTLGLEPASMMLGGLSGRVALGANWLDRALGWRAESGERVAEDGARSQILLSGELALSLPDPNRQGFAYLDDFEESDVIPIPLTRQSWRLGSAPASADRTEDLLPGIGFDAASAGTLVWQHDVLDSAGRTGGALRVTEIDSRIRTVGNSRDAAVLRLAFGGGTAPAWRSITNVLSTTGRDLRQKEYLEFYVRGGASGALVLDLGTVSEDALALDAAGRTGGIDAAGRPWGSGVLDREWDPATEVWSSATHDQRGLWDAGCRAEPGATYPLGDARANCTRGNGLQDTEDLNGNGVLDTDERVRRWIVRLGDPHSPYLVRDTAETRTGFRLYRVPLTADAAVGASASEIQHAKHLRVTVVGQSAMQLAVARMRLVGSGWEKRGESGVVAGLLDVDRLPSSGGRVEADVVSGVSEGDDYVSPPGVTEGLQDATTALGAQGGAEFNEKSLRLRYTAIAPGDRAEVYRAYQGEPRNFLAYRQLRVWALARTGRWGGEGEQLVLRVGSGADNYYLYRTPLREAGAPRSAADWEPETVVEFGRWLRLRAEAERLLLERPAGEMSPVVLWDADSTYAVVIGERGRAPNLAAVRELSIAVWNGGGVAADGEVWIDDIRLAGADREPGAAGQMSLAVRGGNMLHAEVSYSHQDGHFRQLNSPQAYQGDAALAVNASLQLGQLLPDTWALDAPVTVHHQRSASRPVFLNGSDLDARTLSDVRLPEENRTQVRVSLGRRAAAQDRAGWSLWDGFRLGLTYQTADATTSYTSAHHSDVDAILEYRIRPAARSLRLLPNADRWGRVPELLRRSALLAGLSGLSLRWTPASLAFSSGWLDSNADLARYSSLLPMADSVVPMQRSARRRLTHRASLQLRPFASLDGDLSVRSTRDLLPSEQLKPSAAGLIEAERRSIGGLDLGREAERSVLTQLAWTPQLSEWLSAQTTLSGSFSIDHNPSYFTRTARGDDTTATLLRTFGNGRSLSTRVAVDPGALASTFGAVAGDPAADTGPWTAGVQNALRALGPLELGWTRTVDSRFDRSAGIPGIGYQLALLDRDELRTLGSDTATLVAQRTQWSARTHVALLRALTLRMAYTQREGEALGQRSGRVDRETEWPNIVVEWAGLPLPRAAQGLLRNLALSSGYERRAQQREDRTSGEARSTSAAHFPVGVSAVWHGGLSTSYRAEWKNGTAVSPYAATEQAGVQHTFSLRGTFAAPAALLPVFPAPLSVAVRYSSGDRRECRLTRELALCSAQNEFVSYLDETLGIQLDTRAAGMNLGVQMDYRDRHSRVGERNANSQFSIGIFGQFDFSAGTVR